ncbi:MAG: hypothetical protein Q8Q23_02225 [bacterium]|nr:hypothetical protein [bacterium]
MSETISSYKGDNIMVLWRNLEKLNNEATFSDLINYAKAAENIGLLIYYDEQHPELFAEVAISDIETIERFEKKVKIGIVKVLDCSSDFIEQVA